MELIVTYLIYILGIIAFVSIICLTGVRMKQMEFKHDMLKMLIDHDYETENIDLNEFLK